MNRRENLANDIRLFTEKNDNKVNADKWFVEKSTYLNLINRIFELTIDDFETNGKYDFFLEFINHDDRKRKIQLIEISFNENHLNQNSYLIMSNLLISIGKKLNKNNC